MQFQIIYQYEYLDKKTNKEVRTKWTNVSPYSTKNPLIVNDDFDVYYHGSTHCQVDRNGNFHHENKKIEKELNNNGALFCYLT